LATFWAAYAVVTAVALAIYIRIVPSPDQSFFDYMAWLNLHGVPFYKGSFDMTWPGEFVLHQLYILIFGVHSWTARAGDFLLMQPAVLAIYLFVRKAGFPRAAVAAALLYPIIYVTSGGWMAGHRDLTGTHLLIGAAIFALPSKRVSAWQPVLAGLLVGCAVMVRPTYLAFAPLLFFLALPYWKGAASWPAAFLLRAVQFASGLLIPALIFIFWAVAAGTLHDFYVDSFRFVVDVYPVQLGRGRLFGLAGGVLAGMFWWLTIAGGIGGLLWLFLGKSRQGLWLLTAMVAMIFLSYFVQNKGFAYHLGGLIPILLLLGCAGAEAAVRIPLAAGPLRNAAAAIVVLVLIAGTGLRLVHARPTAPDWGRQEQDRPLKLDDSRDLAAIIRAESSPSDTVLQFGWEFQVSYLAERRSATRLVNIPAARLIKPGQAIFGGWLTEFDRGLAEHPPRFILVDQRDMGASDAMAEIVRRRIGDGYAVREQRGRITLLKRIG
jgi:hypothetical protein